MEAFDATYISVGFFDAFFYAVANRLKETTRCAEANDRKTVQPRDL